MVIILVVRSYPAVSFRWGREYRGMYRVRKLLVSRSRGGLFVRGCTILYVNSAPLFLGVRSLPVSDGS